MGMSDNIRNGVEKKKASVGSEEELRDLINMAATASLKQFIQRIHTGEIPIDNMSDFIRVLGAYKEINDISGAMEGKAGQASLPELNMRQQKILEDNEKVKVEEDDSVDISGLSEEDIEEMMRDLDIAQNQSNEEAY